MLTHAESSTGIARWLADLWILAKSGAFADYVAKTYGKQVVRSPSFACVYIAEAESGDMDTGQIGSIITKWWMVDDAGLTEIRRPSLPSRDEPVLFDQSPVVKFFTDRKRIVLGERLGPELICRKSGEVVNKEGSVIVKDLRLLWTSNG